MKRCAMDGAPGLWGGCGGKAKAFSFCAAPAGWPTLTAVSDNAAMPTSPVQRFDPYKNFRFRVKFEGRVVAGASKVSGLPATPHGTGVNKFEPITLERGLTQDTAFQSWASKAGRGVGKPVKPVLEDLVLEEYDETGHLRQAWKLLGCWASTFQSVPELDGKANSLVIEALVLQNEGSEGA
jgi:T4-like virus tail tube protein gp19